MHLQKPGRYPGKRESWPDSSRPGDWASGWSAPRRLCSLCALAFCVWCKSSGSWLFHESWWYTRGTGAKKCRDRWGPRAELIDGASGRKHCSARVGAARQKVWKDVRWKFTLHFRHRRVSCQRSITRTLLSFKQCAAVTDQGALGWKRKV